MTSDTEDNVSVKDVDMNSELEDNTSLTKDAHECNGKKDSVEKNQRSSCHCSVVERQEREIVNLKRKLQERDVYGASASSESENRYVYFTLTRLPYDSTHIYPYFSRFILFDP
jgi:hypothetical protein